MNKKYSDSKTEVLDALKRLETDADNQLKELGNRVSELFDRFSNLESLQEKVNRSEDRTNLAEQAISEAMNEVKRSED